MFQLEKRFEQKMINVGKKEPPIRHYPIAEVLVGQPVWHIVGVLPVKEPDGQMYRRRTHLISTRASLTAGMLKENAFEETAVFVVMPPTLKSRKAEVARCTSLWKCCHKADPTNLGWGWDTEGGSFTDPTDGVEAEDAVKGEIFWKAS